MDSTRRLVFLAVLLLAAAIVPAAAQEPTPVRLRDAVGDTIDRAERDSFHLFPKTAEFHDAVILALPGPEFFAEIRRTGVDSTRNIFLRIMPNDLERIRFLIDNHDYVAAQQRSDSTYAQALASFWRTIEDSPLRNVAGEPAVAREVRPVPTEAATAGRPPLPPVTSENRYNYTLHGITVGSIAGGFLGSLMSVGRATGYQEWYGYRYYYSYYTVNEPVFLAAACGVTALGSYAGYEYGNGLDRKAVVQPLRSEGQGWRTCCAIGACTSGLTLGITTTLLLGGSMYGRTHSGDTERNASALRWIPAVLSGLCVTVEVVTLGYRLGRSIDRGNAL